MPVLITLIQLVLNVTSTQPVTCVEGVRMHHNCIDCESPGTFVDSPSQRRERRDPRRKANLHISGGFLGSRNPRILLTRNTAQNPRSPQLFVQRMFSALPRLPQVAPASTSNRTTGVQPRVAASISAVLPELSHASVSAPASRSNCTTET